MNINDAILIATGGPTIEDGLSAWFAKTAAESLQDAEFRWLGEQLAVGDTIQDRWFDFLSLLPGTLNDKKLTYWISEAP